MEVQFYGANCLRIVTKKAVIVIDDTEGTVAKAGDIALFTGAHKAPKADVKLYIDQPGEYEVSDVSIQGIAARAHMDEEKKHTATIFKITAGDMRLVATGHIYPELSERQLESIGTVDVLAVPVGGSGYTLDPVGAMTIIKEIEPKVVVPTHYADKAITYEVPQVDLEHALKELAMEPKETVAKLKLKSTELGDVMQLIILETTK